jgi:hypothetical protein
MKKKNFFLGAIAVAIALVSGLNILISQSNSDVALPKMVLVNVEALAYELPEVTITCGQNDGQCWDGDCMYRRAPEWLFPMYCWSCDHFNGYQTTACIDYAPC